MDKAKAKGQQGIGSAKEAAGKATDNEDMEAEGKADKTGGKVEEGVENVKDKGKELKDKVT